MTLNSSLRLIFLQSGITFWSRLWLHLCKQLRREVRKLYCVMILKCSFKRVLFHRSMHGFPSCLWCSELCHCWTHADLSSAAYHTPIYFLPRCQVWSPHLLSSSPPAHLSPQSINHHLLFFTLIPFPGENILICGFTRKLPSSIPNTNPPAIHVPSFLKPSLL